ncbi:MAG TPA: metal-binding protein [Pseudomonas sp.]|nr:metal-binding protein [Pseudomonas sp.]
MLFTSSIASTQSSGKAMKDREFDELSELLFKYGNDVAIFTLFELDGFMNALCSAPRVVPPSEWLPAVGGGKLPHFKSKAQSQRYFDLLIKFHNRVLQMLAQATDASELLFEVREFPDGDVVVLEDWCFGYMKGVEVGQWPCLPAGLQHHLDAIALHGEEKNFPLLDEMSPEEHQATVPHVVEAVHRLYLHNRHS